MNDSADKIRNVVIPVVIIATVLIEIACLIYGVSLVLTEFSLLRLIALILVLVGVPFGGYIMVAFWQALADIVDNTSMVSKRLAKMANGTAENDSAEKKKSAAILSDPGLSEKYDSHTLELLNKRKELFDRFKNGGLTAIEKEEVLMQLKEIDSELKRVNHKS